jgi:hypothetical protein
MWMPHSRGRSTVSCTDWSAVAGAARCFYKPAGCCLRGTGPPTGSHKPRPLSSRHFTSKVSVFAIVESAKLHLLLTLATSNWSLQETNSGQPSYFIF